MNSMSYIKKIREFFKNPKKKALSQLAVYLVFFGVVFILIGNATDTENNYVSEVKTPIEAFEAMNSYKYKIVYTNFDKIDTIYGTYFNNTSLFDYNMQKYYYEDDIYIIDNDSYYLSNIEYNIESIFNISDLFEYMEEEAKTTYKDGTIETSYSMNSNIIYKHLYNLESNYNNSVNISIKEQNNLITKIVLNLNNLEVNLKQIEIDYSDIDNIQNLEFNKNNYAYKESL